MRKELTDEWKNRGITQEKDYAILTDEMTKAWSGLSVREYKGVKGLKKESLRDNMTNIELVLNMLAEVTATNLSQQTKPQDMEENKAVAAHGGAVAKAAKDEYEKTTGIKAVSSKNATDKLALSDTDARKLPQ